MTTHGFPHSLTEFLDRIRLRESRRSDGVSGEAAAVVIFVDKGSP